MTVDQYNKSIQTGKLQLSIWGKIRYYMVVLFLLFADALFLWAILFPSSPGVDPPPVISAIIPIILCCLIYIYQKRGLKFRILQSDLKKGDLKNVIKKLCAEQKWSTEFEDENTMVVRTDMFNIWRATKQITILFDQNTVYINSIFDPWRNKSGLDIDGSNKRIVETIIDRLQWGLKITE